MRAADRLEQSAWRGDAIIRAAEQDDLDFLDRHDPLLRREILAEKVSRGEVYVAQEAGQCVALARFNYLCDLDPFLTLILVLEAHRRQGIGTRLMRHWEGEMRRRGHRVLLTSTEVDESAQQFYRKRGFADSGALLFPGQAAAELFLVKPLRPAAGGVGPRQKS
ncbi:MAG: GNAT family N-acetyltransferase [Candidatus Eisenbacteria bacterium]|nr:GNAT family N-acetyltransferase [Candidatus Eisenbacteria bacterium]